MIMDLMSDSWIYECDSDTVIPYTNLVNTTILAGHKCFKLNFDFNINVSSVCVDLLTLSGVTASGFYGEINDLGYPCVHYSMDDCLSTVNSNYLDLNFENMGVTQIPGVVCSGMCFDGESYLQSEPYFLFDCSYTTLLYFMPSGVAPPPITVDDNFTGINGEDVDVRRWVPNKPMYSIYNNKCRCNTVDDDYGDGFCSIWKLSGDFDVQIDFEVVNGSNNYWMAGIKAEIDETHYVGIMRGFHSIQQITRRFQLGGSSYSDPDYNTTTTSGNFKITRTNSECSVYYDIGSGWVELGSPLVIGTEDVKICVFSWLWGSIRPPITVDFDNFKRNSGTVIWAGAQDNLFFRADGPNNEFLGIGITFSNNLSVSVLSGGNQEVIDTGMPVLFNEWNLLSLRCSPKTKLRIGCNDSFVELNKPCAFLGGSIVLCLGGKPGCSYFCGSLSDFTWWPSYADNVFVEYAEDDPSTTLNGQFKDVSTSITSSGVTFDLCKNYPSRIYLNFDFPVSNMITGISVNTYDDNYILASGVDTLFCGTVVRGYTSTDFPIELYNNTDYQTYAYMFAYDSNRYKALSVSSDAINYYSNQITLPQDVSWGAGEFKSGINNDIIIDTPYTTEIESNLKIILHDNSRKCLWYLSKDDFGFYDLRTNNFYNRTYPYFVSEATGIYNTKNYWEFGVDGNCIYLIHYKNGVYEYNTVSDSWSLIHSISECDNVCVSTSENYIYYVYYYLSKSEVFRYDINSGVETSVCSFSTSSLKIESNRDVLFVFNGSTIFKYDVDTLNIIAVSQNIGLSSVLEIKDICGYLSIITTSAVYSLAYSQDGWGVLLKVYGFSSSFSISTVNICAQNIAFVKSNTVYLARLSHYRYMSTEINIRNNYNNTLSLLPKSTDRYKIVWAWLDTDESVSDFYLASKFSMGESIIYGFSRDTEPTAGTMSVFMSFNFVTKKYVNLASVVPNNIIDVENGCLVETYDVVYYINFNKGHYYKYIISTDTWVSISPPKTYSNVSNCTITSAVWDLDKKIYIAGESLGGYIYTLYNKTGDRYYSFFGYIDIDTDVIHSLYYLPCVTLAGKQNSGSDLVLGGASFTCDLNYNVDNKYLFLAVSQYTSLALSNTYDMSVATPSGVYVFDSLDALYDYGCIIYNPCTGSKYNNLMNDCYFYTAYVAAFADSDIPERQSIYMAGAIYTLPFEWEGGSIGLKTDYEFSVHTRVKIPITPTTYMPVILDSYQENGFEVGFDDTEIIACCRKDTTSLTITYPMSSAGVSKGDWVDFGVSLSCVSGTSINLYINGQNITSSGIGTTCSGYTPDAVLHFFYTVGSPYMNNSSSYYGISGLELKITEFTTFNRVLSDQEFSDISYNNNSGKLIARLLMDYNVINTSRLPQSSYDISTPPDLPIYRYDGVTRVYSIYDYTSGYVYYLSDYTLIKLDVLTSSTSCINLRKDYNSNCDYNFEIATIKNCFVATNMNTVAGESVYGPVYIGNSVFDDSTKYYDIGSFVSPIIDVGETGIISYNFEYSLVRDAYLEFYMRYANDKPVDFCHIYYIDSSDTFIESSLATGKIFHTSSVNFSKSCDVYYDNTIIKITIDGSVYKSTNYTTPTDVFSLTGYTLNNITSTWFSYNGAYILYYTSDKYLVGFPLSIGIPCMRSSVTYNAVNYVSWSKYAQRLAVSVGAGVYVYNYMLGEEEYIAGAYRVFYIYEGSVVIKSTDKSVLLNNDGIYYKYIVDDIDFSKPIEFDYVTEWMYYVTLSGNLKRMRYIQSISGYELEFLDTGVSSVNSIYKITFDYVILTINAEFTTYTKNGFIAVSNYPLPFINSGNVVFFDYNPTNKTAYYNLNYLSDNDLIWSDLLDWVPLGAKSSGFVVGKRYVQLKAIFKTSSNKNATPILSRVYFGSPVRVGPILPHSAKDFFVKLDVPLDDQGDIYSVKLITLAEDIVS